MRGPQRAVLREERVRLGRRVEGRAVVERRLGEELELESERAQCRRADVRADALERVRLALESLGVAAPRRRDHERDRRVALLVESAHHLACARLVAMEGRAHHGGLLRG